ncbi:MAG TPA: 50S ribosomal protein L4 [Patescibacteria group bacterium]|nr:50S ribosomal protein L4 [Patescibacteria group bacterium]
MPESKIKNQKSNIKSSTTQKAKVVAVSRAAAPKAEKTVTAKSTSLSLPVFSIDGAKSGTISLPAEIFGAKINEDLMTQAIRVYLVNQRQGTASTKTRGEVIGSTRKIYRQKGTGRARHGAIKAPIFVGGGIAHGPKPRNFELKLSKQMKKKAIFSALSQKLAAGRIIAIDVTGASGKTSEMNKLLKTLEVVTKKNKTNKFLFVADAKSVVRSVRNIDGASVLPTHSINTYEVLNSSYLVITKDSIPTLEKVFLGK